MPRCFAQEMAYLLTWTAFCSCADLQMQGLVNRGGLLGVPTSLRECPLLSDPLHEARGAGRVLCSISSIRSPLPDHTPHTGP